MIFYSGYSLKNDSKFFKNYINHSEYCVAGFSYGAIKAFEYAYENKERLDLLQLFSPAFFQSQKDSFKKLQLKSYDKSKGAYIEQFITNCFLPYERKKLEYFEGSKEDLHKLLYYEWESEKIEALMNRGVNIEVYLGSDDKIIDVNSAELFFKQFATVHMFKNANHFLLKN